MNTEELYRKIGFEPIWQLLEKSVNQLIETQRLSLSLDLSQYDLIPQLMLRFPEQTKEMSAQLKTMGYSIELKNNALILKIDSDKNALTKVNLLLEEENLKIDSLLGLGEEQYLSRLIEIINNYPDWRIKVNESVSLPRNKKIIFYLYSRGSEIRLKFQIGPNNELLHPLSLDCIISCDDETKGRLNLSKSAQVTLLNTIITHPTYISTIYENNLTPDDILKTIDKISRGLKSRAAR